MKVGAQDKKWLTWPCLVQGATRRPSPAPSRRQHRGHRLPQVGCASSGLPLPGLHCALLMPTESIKGRAHWAGVPGGPCFILRTGAWSPTEAPQ